jgi:hypothetical protein
MNSFNIITKKIVTNIDYQQYVIFNIFINELKTYDKCEYFVHRKFMYIDKVMKNIFYNQEVKDEIWAIFNKIQKTYNTFTKISRIFKYKKTKTVVDTDLCMNKLNESDKNVICILQNDNKYLFNIYEILKIIDTSLINSQYFFSIPLNIKNPYNNIPFNKSTLYNIYFFVKFKTCYYNELLIKFFNTNFNINVFTKRHESILREYIISNYVNKSSDDILYEDIMEMISYSNSCILKKQINIDDDFPIKTLVKIMKPYLYLWMVSLHSLIPVSKTLSYDRFCHKITKFNKFNPIFGRRVIKINHVYTNENTIKFVQIEEFNDKHPKFICESKSFLSTHIVKY